MKNLLAVILFSVVSIFAQNEKDIKINKDGKIEREVKEIVIKRIGPGDKEIFEGSPKGIKKIIVKADGKEGFLRKLNLTEEQKSKVEKIQFETKKNAIELGAKLALLKLEIASLLKSENIDKSSVEKKIKESFDKTSALFTNRLDSWFKVNDLLNAEQKKLWKVVLNKRKQAGNLREKIRFMHPSGSGINHGFGGGEKFDIEVSDSGYGYWYGTTDNDDGLDSDEKEIQVKIIKD